MQDYVVHMSEITSCLSKYGTNEGQYFISHTTIQSCCFSFQRNYFLVSFTHSIVKESLSKRSIRDYGLDSLSPNNFVFSYQQAKEVSESSVRGH